MRKALKIVHTLAACGLIGAMLAYFLVLVFASQSTASAYADARMIISQLCDYLALPSMALAVVSGLLAMVVHRPFQNTRWAWLKALLGLSLFEATLAIVQAKATTAAALSAALASGAGDPGEIAMVLANERRALGAI